MGLAIGAFNVHVPGALPPQEDLCTIKDFVRQYTATRLRENNFNRLADSLTGFANAEPSLAYGILFKKCFRLTEEKREEFEDICNQLNIDGHNLEEMYHRIVIQIFSDVINFGRILAFTVFSAELVVHCARQGREDRAIEVASWGTDIVTQRRLDQWVQDQGGWDSVASQPIDDQYRSEVIVIATTMVAVISIVAIATSVLIVKNST